MSLCPICRPPAPVPPGMEDVVAGQSLSACHHFLSTDDADIVHCLQLLGGGIWVPGQHVRAHVRTRTCSKVIRTELGRVARMSPLTVCSCCGWLGET